MTDLTNDEQELLAGFDMNLSKEIITQSKNDILQRLPLNREELKTFHKKLKGYRYIDNLDDFKIGNYVRWINLGKLLEREKNEIDKEETDKEKEEKEQKEKEINNNITPSLKLTNGGFICEMVESSDGKPKLLCRNSYNRMFEISLNKCIVFQKLNNHENIIMSILQYIKND